MNNMAERIKQIFAGTLPPPPVQQLVGFDFVKSEHGEAVFEMNVIPEKHHNPGGTMHGGVMCDIADAAMGMAFGTTLVQDGEFFTTINLQINFLKAHIQGKLIASAKVITRGRSIGYLECDLTNQAGDLIARAQCTQKILRQRKQ